MPLNSPREFRNIRRLLGQIIQQSARPVLGDILKGLIAFIGIILTCLQVKINSDQSRIIQYQGYYELARERPRLDRIEFARDSLGLGFRLVIREGRPVTETQAVLFASLRYVNRGESPATLRLITYGVSQNSATEMRDWILNKDEPEGTLSNDDIGPDSLNAFDYSVQQLQENDTLTLKVAIPWMWIPDDSIAYFHNFLLYQNEFGVFYDTYFMMKLRYKPVVVSRKYGFDSTQGIVSADIKVANEDMRGLVDSLTTNSTVFIYPPQDTLKLREFIDGIENRVP